MGALYGFGTAFAVLLVWMVVGEVRERVRTLNAITKQVAEVAQLSLDLRAEVLKLQTTGASATLKDLAKRVDSIEETLAADRLEMLDISERVAHKLQDRQRKRDTAKSEAGDDGEEHDSYAARLARARAAYPLDPRQGSIFGDAP